MPLQAHLALTVVIAAVCLLPMQVVGQTPSSAEFVPVTGRDAQGRFRAFDR